MAGMAYTLLIPRYFAAAQNVRRWDQMINRIARIISILGHPALLMPFAAAIASGSTGNPNALFLSVIIAVFFAALVIAYSLAKTRAGQWKHVDASIKTERKELNQAASLTLLVSAVILALLNVHPGIVFAVGLSGGIVIAGQFLSKIAKPSLHVSFAVFAACLTWPNKIAFFSLLLSAVFIAWARLRLKRHTRFDLALGAGLGIFAGFCFQAIIRSL